MGFSPIFCFYFFIGSAYLLYIVHTHIQGHFHRSQSVSCSHCICYFAPSHDALFVQFSQSLQGSSSAFEGMDHFLKTRLFSGLYFLRAKVHETTDHCTIMRRSQCLTPHHLETLVRSLIRKLCLSQFVRSSPGQDSSLLHV